MTPGSALEGDRTELPQACARCAVRSHSLCRALSDADLATLNAISRHRQFVPGQTLVHEGSPALIGIVVDGTLIERKSLRDGREQIVSLLFAADMIGTTHGTEADASLEAVSPVTVCTFDRAGFDQALAKLPHLHAALLDHVRQELSQARQWMLLLGQKTASEKVATFLLRLADRAANAGCVHAGAEPIAEGKTFHIPITRAQTAALLGLTIETVSRKLTDLQRAGAITLDGTRSVCLSSLPALRAAAN